MVKWWNAEEVKPKVECSDDTKVKMNAIDNELSKIVGLDDLKLQLAKFLKGMLLDERRRALGLKIGPTKLPHFAFHAYRGTGKSMVARMLAKLLHLLGVLPTDKVTEVGTPSELLHEPHENVLGGILLVNHCDLRGGRYDPNDPVFKDLRRIIPFMDTGKVVVIIAGCRGDFHYVLSTYGDLGSRVSNNFYFNTYSPEDLVKILQSKLSNEDENSPFYGYKLHPSCTADVLAEFIKKAGHSIENGHIVDEMLVKAKENLDSRVDVESMDGDSWVTITSDDFAAAVRQPFSK